MEVPFFPVITAQFVAKDDSIIQFQLFDRNVADVEDRNSPMSPGQGEYYDWFHADWRVPAEQPIVIEWSGDKKNTIVGSTCTVTLISPYDGALQPLYTTDPRQFCCLISRKARGEESFSNVWFGWLDPEFYEEPFIAKKDYEVTLTFSDFGMLKRLRVTEPGTDMAHQYSVMEYLTAALGIIYPGYDQSTDYSRNGYNFWNTFCGGTGAPDLKINLANFTDEDGETMTWYEVLEALLKPLALRVEQRAGKFYLYDLHTLAGNRREMVDTRKFEAYMKHYTPFGSEHGVNLISIYSNQYENDGTYFIMTDAEIETAPGLLRAAYSYAQEENRVYSGPQRAVGYTDQPLYSDSAVACEVEWTSDDQMLAVDETYNNVRITFSPYTEAVLFDPEKDVSFETNEDFKPIKNGYDYDSDEEYDSFLLSTYNPPSTADVVKGGLIICGGTTMFKIKSLQGADDCEGVIAFLADYNNDDANSPELNEHYYHLDYDGNVLYTGFRRTSQIQQAIISDGMTGQALYRTRRIMIPNAYGKPSLAWAKTMLKIQIPMLYDQRYNPWEQADTDHNAMRAGGLGIKGRANSIGLRLNIRLYKQQTGGSPILFYQNIAWVDWTETAQTVTMQTQIVGDTDLPPGWQPYINFAGSQHRQDLPTLIMYNKFDGSKVDSEDSPCLGGMQDGGMPFNNKCDTDHYFRKNNDGLFVPFPSIAPSNNDYQANYWLELEVTDGLYIYDKGGMKVGSGDLSNIYLKNPVSASNFGNAPYGDCRWWLVGFPTIKVVGNVNNIYEEAETDDIEQSGVIDANAAEELSIDSICGCCDSVFAKGAYLVNGNPVTTLRRGIRTASAEQLLIGTLYSQYAGRHLKLRGTARAILPLQGLYVLKDNHYPDKRFLVTSEVYNAIEGESELTMTEVSPDSYTSS